MRADFRTVFAGLLPWAGQILLWLGLTAFVVSKDADLEWGLFSRGENTLFWPVCYGVLFNALVFYGNALWLMPHWIKYRKRYLLYAGCAILTITIAETWLDVWYALHQPVIVAEVRNNFHDKMKGPWTDDYLAPLMTVSSFFLNLFMHTIFWALSLAYRLYRDRAHDEKIRDVLMREKMRAELNYLRAQINPHFLFNGINSIYHLMDRDTEKAREVLLRFSGLLRYQLYECGSDSIALDKELDYLENYISLEKVRKGDDAQVEYAISAAQTNWKIAPMLLTPVIENAFKYLSQHSDPAQNCLFIDLAIENGELDLLVKNTYQPDLSEPQQAGGLGLQNVRTRLALLYPGKHRFSAARHNNTFQAQLQIQLDHA